MATVKLRLDTRPKSNGLHNVKIAVYHKDEKKFFGTAIDISKEDFNQVSKAIKGGLNLRRDDKIRIKDILQERLNEAQNICENLGNRFSYFRFTEIYTDTKTKSDSLEFLFEEFIQQKYKKGKIGTAKSYNNAKQSFLSFSPKATITDITVSFLENYQDYMTKKQRSRTSIGIYIRSLRTIYNRAIDANLVNSSDYPFGKGKFDIPAPNGRKMALETDELIKLLDYKAESEAEQRALDFFWISYYANGINFKDIILLRESNFVKNEIRLKREKTKHKDKRDIVISVTEPLKELIDRNRIFSLVKNPLIFDIISEQDSLEEQNKKLRQFIKTTNKYLKRIALKLNLSMDVTTYTARHSYATVALRQGITVSEISEALGHTNITTTENYLKSFPEEQRRVNAEKTANLRGMGNG